MKKVLLVLVFLALGFSVFAQVTPAPAVTDTPKESVGVLSDLAQMDIIAMQGVIHTYKKGSGGFQQVTCFPLAEYKPVAAWPKIVNDVLTPVGLAGGVAYGTTPAKAAALVSYDLVKLSDYLPFTFPLKKFIDIQIFPIGLEGDWNTHPKTKICYGGAYLKLTIPVGD